MDAPSCVRSYKALANVERAFRSLKTVDLKVRPIHHRLADRVRAHILLCMLAFYVEWHMREAWRELMFADTDQAAKATRDPVAPAERSALGAAQGRIEAARRRRTCAQLCHLDGGDGPSCATPAERPAPGRCTDLRGTHHPQRTSAARSCADPGDPTVVRNPNPKSIASG
jgi:hypothetical protein